MPMMSVATSTSSSVNPIDLSARRVVMASFSARVNSVNGSTLTIRLVSGAIRDLDADARHGTAGIQQKTARLIRIHFGGRQNGEDAIALRQFQAARKFQIRRARDQHVVFRRDPHFDHLLAAAGAIDGGVEKTHDGIRHRAQTQGFDAGGGARDS